MRERGANARKIEWDRGDLEQRCRKTEHNSEEQDSFVLWTFFAFELSAIYGALELKVSFLKQRAGVCCRFCETVGRRRR